MSLKIDRGLFKYDLIDHHAILCIPVDGDVKDIRKRYLKIARRLHPDTITSASDAEKSIASELLSKLVNPAYEKLSADRTRAEYIAVLSQMGKRLVQESGSVELSTDLARQLAVAPNVELLYKSAIAKIAETQFDSLPQVVQIIAHVSELNLVYLMRTAGKSFAPPASTPAKTNSIANESKAGKPPASQAPQPPSREEAVVLQYIRRAEELIAKNQFAPARIELQDGLKLEPKNSRCHSLIGFVYLKQNQLKMAKIHFDNALKLDPNDTAALQWIPKIEKVLAQQSGASKVTSSSNNGSKQPDKSGGGGLFGLFGGKKK